MTLTKEDLEILTAPIAKERVSVKVQSLNKDRTKAMLVLYLQHTDVYALVEKVDPAWSCQILHEEFREGLYSVRARMTIKGVSRENTGEGSDPKSACSDALKRCAMLFGVGRYLYDSPGAWVPYNEQTDRFKQYTKDDYDRALRPGQERTPDGNSSPKIKPSVQSTLKAGPGPNPANRIQLGSEIVTARNLLNLTSEALENWVFDEFKKTTKDLSIPEMQKLLEMLQHEVGRAGVIA